MNEKDGNDDYRKTFSEKLPRLKLIESFLEAMFGLFFHYNYIMLFALHMSGNTFWLNKRVVGGILFIEVCTHMLGWSKNLIELSNEDWRETSFCDEWNFIELLVACFIRKLSIISRSSVYNIHHYIIVQTWCWKVELHRANNESSEEYKWNSYLQNCRNSVDFYFQRRSSSSLFAIWIIPKIYIWLRLQLDQWIAQLRCER